MSLLFLKKKKVIKEKTNLNKIGKIWYFEIIYLFHVPLINMTFSWGQWKISYLSFNVDWNMIHCVSFKHKFYPLTRFPFSVLHMHTLETHAY